MFWLSVERYENWLADQKSGFAFLGIGERKLKLAEEIKPGDVIVTYVSSGYSSFSGFREVVSEKPKKSLIRAHYDEPFPYQIDTKPILSLPPEKWVKIHNLVGKLSFLPKNLDWRQNMRNALRKLNERDAKQIIDLLKATTR
jgi:predicted RNA-binding protein